MSIRRQKSEKWQTLGPLQKKWLKELRSGKHKQARNKLYDGKGYCCLGVLCGPVEGIKPVQIDDTWNFNGETFNLPKNIIEKYGFHDVGGDAIIPHYSESTDDIDLVSLNDAAKKTFGQIAQMIENNPQRYFKKAV